jgi:hypothetical protein
MREARGEFLRAFRLLLCHFETASVAFLPKYVDAVSYEDTRWMLHGRF